MARQVQAKWVDDVDGSAAQETVAFALDGRHFEIDLSAANADRLRDDLEPYVRKARPTAPPAPRPRAAAIRRWAKENGYEVSDRGPIHRDIIEAHGNATRK